MGTGAVYGCGRRVEVAVVGGCSGDCSCRCFVFVAVVAVVGAVVVVVVNVVGVSVDMVVAMVVDKWLPASVWARGCV